MKSITKRVWCHLSLSDQEKHSIEDVRASIALDVNTFSELVGHIAHISYQNPDYSLFFRAQSKDYQTHNKRSSIYPSIYRKLSDVKSRRIDFSERYAILREAEQELLYEFNRDRILGVGKLTKFRELRWAILQHYNVCRTPLLDLTQSLRVACSFALDCITDYPHVFVFGFPHINGSISYYVEEELLNVKLLSICPPRAVRPYFQEGFLVGSFPSSEEKKSPQLDVARRLIAKFRLKRETFEDKNFSRIPHETLYPTNDAMERVCQRIRDRLAGESAQGSLLPSPTDPPRGQNKEM